METSRFGYRSKCRARFAKGGPRTFRARSSVQSPLFVATCNDAQCRLGWHLHSNRENHHRLSSYSRACSRTRATTSQTNVAHVSLAGRSMNKYLPSSTSTTASVPSRHSKSSIQTGTRTPGVRGPTESSFRIAGTNPNPRHCGSVCTTATPPPCCRTAEFIRSAISCLSRTGPTGQRRRLSGCGSQLEAAATLLDKRRTGTR